MPANWATFIPDVKDLILSHPESPRVFGETLAKHYVSAVSSGAASVFGQTHNNTIGEAALVSTYGEWFEKLREEDLDPPMANEIDEGGNEIEFSGKESDPDFADPDMTESEKPIIDPEKFNTFIEDYSVELNLHKFKHFEFNLKGGETFNEATNIIVDRLVSSLNRYSGNSRVDFIKWVRSFGLWATGYAGVSARNNYKDGVKASINSHGFDADDFIKSVRTKFLDILRIAYDTSSYDTVESLIRETPLHPIQILNETITFRHEVIQEVFDKGNDSEDYEVSSILTNYFITYFTYSGSITSSILTNSLMENVYDKSELKAKWLHSPDVNSKEDILNKSGGTLYMYTRQEMIDAMDESEEDGNADAYMELAKAIIAYWKATGPQPLKSMPAAFPCTISAPLGGKYIPVYYGSVSKLAEDIRKSLNSGKTSNDANVAALKVAKGLSLAYSRNLIQMKFVYLGGIPTPLGSLPMIGFVPFVF